MLLRLGCLLVKLFLPSNIQVYNIFCKLIWKDGFKGTTCCFIRTVWKNLKPNVMCTMIVIYNKYES